MPGAGRRSHDADLVDVVDPWAKAMQIAKSHRYVSASGPSDRQAALAAAENEGWRIPPVAVSAARKRTAGGRFPEARGPNVHARERDFGYGDHG